MAVRTIEELTGSIIDRIGNDNSDEALALLEDVFDTLTDLQTRANGGGEDWKSKYENNDREWRERYRERFNEPVKINDEPNIIDDEKLTYDKLFMEE